MSKRVVSDHRNGTIGYAVIQNHLKSILNDKNVVSEEVKMLRITGNALKTNAGDKNLAADCDNEELTFRPHANKFRKRMKRSP